MTPEGKIKKAVTELLRTYERLWFTMPVPSGYGESTLDYLCCIKGLFFAIETKRPGGKPTLRQSMMMQKMEAAGAAVFVVDGLESLARLQEWLDDVYSEGDGDRPARSKDSGAVSAGSGANPTR